MCENTSLSRSSSARALLTGYGCFPLLRQPVVSVPGAHHALLKPPSPVTRAGSGLGGWGRAADAGGRAGVSGRLKVRSAPQV